jgi:hypothetical protein
LKYKQLDEWSKEGESAFMYAEAFAIIQRDVKVFCCHTNDYEIYFAQMIVKRV